MKGFIGTPWAKTIMFFAFLLFSILAGLGFGVVYEGNDDVFINLLAVGAFGPQSQYLVHMNTAYGFLLKGLYGLFPGLNWYFWMQLTVNVNAIALLGIALTKKVNTLTPSNINRNIRYVICGLSFLGFASALAPDFLIRLQYTKSGMLYSAAGLYFLYEGLFSKENRRMKFILGTIFTLLGEMFRIKCLMFLFPFFVLALCFGIWKNGKEQLLSIIRKLLIPAALVFFLFFFDMYCYSSDPEWDSFRRFNTLREDIMDYNSLDYGAHAAEYEAAGILPGELAMLKAWNYGDTRVFTPEKLQQIRDILYRNNSHGLSLSPWALKQTVRVLWENVKSRPLALLSCGLLFFLFFLPGKREKLFLILFAGLFMAELWYLSCLGRTLWRAGIGSFLGLLVFVPVLTGADSPEVPEKERKAVPGFCRIISAGAFLGLFLLLLCQLPAAFLSPEGILARPAGAPLTEAFFKEAGEEQFYVGGSSAFLIEREIEDEPLRLTGTAYGGYFRGFSFLGGWPVPSPSALYQVRQAGHADPMEALLEGGALFAGEEEEARLLEEYLWEEYGLPGSLVSRGEAGGIPLWIYKEAR